ncbi:MAG: hypothetical protein ACYTKD_04460 [Planctomycetota bacterium]|jgi:hypothetical protein
MALALSLAGLACERARAPSAAPVAGDEQSPTAESSEAGPRELEPSSAEAATLVKTRVKTPVTTPEAPPEAPPEPGYPDGFALDAARPMRVTWPLDVGRYTSPLETAAGRMCLRGRQGANEIQIPGEGRALYGFRVARAGSYRTYLRVRWLADGIGSVDCNNSWFAALDGAKPVVVGNDNETTSWHWERGPSAELEAGTHWLRVELREDGVFCDRLAVVPEGASDAASALDALPLAAPAGLEGERPPTEPQSPVRDVEIATLRTRSVVIGKGHANEVTVLASYQERNGAFRGRIVIHSPTAPGLRVEGDGDIACDARSPHAAARLVLRFPEGADRQIHRARVRVVSEGGTCVFEEGLVFKKPFAWAFLGPFPDPSRGRSGVTRMGDHEIAPLLGALSRRAAPEEVARLRGSRGTPTSWRVVGDGSCYGELGEVDMFRVFGPRRNCFAYAVTWVLAETRLNHRSFTLSADDTASLWMGGRLVASMPLSLPKECNRLWTSTPLRRGPNPVVVKIAQGPRYWGFRFDVVDWHWQGRRGDVIRGADPADWLRE